MAKKRRKQRRKKAAAPPKRRPVRLIPPAYGAVEGGTRRLARTFGLALFVRFVLMPIACHGDLLSSYHRSFDLLSRLIPKRLVPHELIQAAFLKLYSPFLPLSELLAWEGGTMAPFEFWMDTFVVHPLAMPALFLFKVPYLLCDLGVALVFLHYYAETPQKGLRAAAIWLFNPVTIFVFYVFGRHDVVAILFIALALLSLQRLQPLRGALWLGVSIWSRYYSAILLPFLAALHPGSRRKKLAILAAGAAPMVFYNLLGALLHPRHGSVSARMVQSKFGDYVLGFDLPMGWSQEIFVFPAAIAMLFVYSLAVPRKGNLVLRFSQYATCALALFYATVYFHPQYFTWIVPFLVILRVEEERPVIRNLHYLMMALFVPTTFFFGASLFGLLLAPLDREFFMSIPAPWDMIRSFGSPRILVNLARTGMTATCLFMVFWILFGDRWQASQADRAGPKGFGPADSGAEGASGARA